MGAGQSAPYSQASICKISEEQILKLDQEIKKINAIIIQFKRNSKNYNSDYVKFITDKSKSESKTSVEQPPPLSVKKVMLLEELVKILKKYQTMLNSIARLCKKYQSSCVADVVVDEEIDEIVLEDLSKAQMMLNQFLGYIEILHDDDDYDGLKGPVDITITIINEINERFLKIDNIKEEMKTMCHNTCMILRSIRAGGKTTRTRSKKRKQMKMKIKSSSKHLSKTRNSKKKYNGKSVKKVKKNELHP